MDIVQHEGFTWEPARLLLVSKAYSERDFCTLKAFFEKWMEGRRSEAGCQCYAQYLKVSPLNSGHVQVLCQWLCSTCLPKLLSNIEETCPFVERVELGFRQDACSRTSAYIEIPDKEIVFEGGERVFVPGFLISQSAVTVGQMLAFCRAAGYKTTAEKAGESSTFQSSFALSGVKGEAKMKRPACYLSFHDADGYCSWSGHRLPTEAEFLSAFLADSNTREEYDSTTQAMVRRLLEGRKLPTAAGLSITSTTTPMGEVVMRRGPKYVLVKGWQAELALNRCTRAKEYHDVETTFHVVKL